MEWAFFLLCVLAIVHASLANREESVSSLISSLEVGAGSVLDYFTPSCQTKLCGLLSTVVTCPSFGVNVPTECVEYFLGWQFSCPGYSNDIGMAPSICREYLESKDTSSDSLLPLVPAFKTESYKANCATECFNTYLAEAINVNDECGDTLEAVVGMLNPDSAFAAVYKLTNTVHGQTCATNNQTASVCMDLFTMLANATASGDDDSAGMPSFPISLPKNYQCLTPLMPPCQALAMGGCCLSTVLPIFQELTSPMVPPCLLSYVTNTCGLSLTSPCTPGTQSPSALLTARVSLAVPFDLSNKTEYKQLAQALTYPLSLPYLVLSVFNYTSTDYDFQLTLNGQDAIGTLQNASLILGSPVYTQTVSALLGGSPVTLSEVSSVKTFQADPFTFVDAAFSPSWATSSLLGMLVAAVWVVVMV